MVVVADDVRWNVPDVELKIRAASVLCLDGTAPVFNNTVQFTLDWSTTGDTNAIALTSAREPFASSVNRADFPLPLPGMGDCIMFTTSTLLNEAERTIIDQHDYSTTPLLMRQRITFEFENGTNADTFADFVIPIVDEVQRRQVPFFEANELLGLSTTKSGRSLPLTSIWYTSAAVLGLISLVGFAVARPLLSLASRAEGSADRARSARAEAEERREVAEAQRDHMNRILTATHHELNREITMVGFVVDDLADDGLPVGDLVSAYGRLEEGRDSVAALAQLGTGTVDRAHQLVSAEDLVVFTDRVEIEPRTIAPLVGVDRLLLRTLVKNAARNAEFFGGATSMVIETTASSLVISDNGSSATQDQIDAALAGTSVDAAGRAEGFDVMKQVVDAHGAEMTVTSSTEAGVIVSVDFSSVDTTSIDLRSEVQTSRAASVVSAPADGVFG